MNQEMWQGEDIMIEQAAEDWLRGYGDELLLEAYFVDSSRLEAWKLTDIWQGTIKGRHRQKLKPETEFQRGDGLFKYHMIFSAQLWFLFGKPAIDKLAEIIEKILGYEISERILQQWTDTASWQRAVESEERKLYDRDFVPLSSRELSEPVDPIVLREAVFLNQRGLECKEIETKIGMTPDILIEWRQTYEGALESDRQMFLWMLIMSSMVELGPDA